jgi:hypothetical protein
MVQLAKLVKLSKPEIFDSNFIPDCSENDDIGCVWTRCKTAWNAKSNKKEPAIDVCFEVAPHAKDMKLMIVPSRLSVLAVLGFD